MSKTTDLIQRDLDARRRACLDQEQTHLRAGDWRGLQDSEVRLVGLARDLHGTVCTCCPKRGAA